jgi:hypothetical protein
VSIISGKIGVGTINFSNTQTINQTIKILCLRATYLSSFPRN